MVNNSIVQGLKIAVERGSTLENAMLSFYNANCPKEEIEEAARALQMGDRYMPEPNKPVEKIATQPLPTMPQPTQPTQSPANQQPMIPPTQPLPTMPQPTLPTQPPVNQLSIPKQPEIIQTPTQSTTPPTEPEKPKIKQKASQYGNKQTKSKTKTAIIFLVIILILLLGLLGILFLFKGSLIDFFNRTF